MKRVLAVVNALLLFVACSPRVDERESPGGKREWAILQTLEYQTRAERLETIQFRVVEEFEIVGVPRSGNPGVVWIMLNPAHSPFYKQMPRGTYTLSPDQIEVIVTGHRVTPTVEEALRSHVP